jgi:hypothetical protein
MALSDSDRAAMEWALLIPGLLNTLGDLTGQPGLKEAARTISSVPVESIGQVLGALRTDHVDINGGTMEVGDGVDVEVVDG